MFCHAIYIGEATLRFKARVSKLVTQHLRRSKSTKYTVVCANGPTVLAASPEISDHSCLKEKHKKGCAMTAPNL